MILFRNIVLHANKIQKSTKYDINSGIITGIISNIIQRYIIFVNKHPRIISIIIYLCIWKGW